MIIKKMKGAGFRGVLSYVLNDEEAGQQNRAEVIGGNMAGLSVQELTREFAQLRYLKPGAANPVRHFAIRLHPRDRALSVDQWNRLAEDFCEQFGYGNTYRAFVLHQDSHPPHLHIITSQISFEGKLNREFKDIPRIKFFCRTKEQALALATVNNRATGRAKLYHQRRRGDCQIDRKARQAEFRSLLEASTQKPVQVAPQSHHRSSTVGSAPSQYKQIIHAVQEQAKTHSRFMELLLSEGSLLEQMKRIKGQLVAVRGTHQEKLLLAQLADVEKQLAMNLMAKLRAWSEEAKQQEEHKKQLRRGLKL